MTSFLSHVQSSQQLRRPYPDRRNPAYIAELDAVHCAALQRIEQMKEDARCEARQLRPIAPRGGESNADASKRRKLNNSRSMARTRHWRALFADNLATDTERVYRKFCALRTEVNSKTAYFKEIYAKLESECKSVCEGMGPAEFAAMPKSIQETCFAFNLQPSGVTPPISSSPYDMEMYGDEPFRNQDMDVQTNEIDHYNAEPKPRDGSSNANAKAVVSMDADAIADTNVGHTSITGAQGGESCGVLTEESGSNDVDIDLDSRSNSGKSDGDERNNINLIVPMERDGCATLHSQLLSPLQTLSSQSTSQPQEQAPIYHTTSEPFVTQTISMPKDLRLSPSLPQGNDLSPVAWPNPMVSTGPITSGIGSNNEAPKVTTNLNNTLPPPPSLVVYVGAVQDDDINEDIPAYATAHLDEGVFSMDGVSDAHLVAVSPTSASDIDEFGGDFSDVISLDLLDKHDSP